MSDTTYKSKVGYKSPIKLDYHDGTPEIKIVMDHQRDFNGKILDQVEEYVIARCSVAVGAKIDREELIKALRYDRGQYEKGYDDGKRDAIEALQANVKRLKEANDELREAQTYIDHYGDKWLTSAKDVPTAAYEHGYADGRDEAEAQLPKRGEWIKHPEVKNIYGGVYIECPFCGEKYVVQNVLDEKFCRNCGADLRAKMEVQDEAD